MDYRRYGLGRFNKLLQPSILFKTWLLLRQSNILVSPLLRSQRQAEHDEYHLGLCGDSMAITPFLEQRLSEYGAASSRSIAASERASTTTCWTRLVCFYPWVSVNRRMFTQIRWVSMIQNNTNKHILYSSSPSNFASLVVYVLEMVDWMVSFLY